MGLQPAATSGSVELLQGLLITLTKMIKNQLSLNMGATEVQV